MLENGMLINQRTYDVQMQEPEKVQCFVCGEWVPEYEIDERIDDPRGCVCEDCEETYCRMQVEDTGIQQAFISEHEDEFYIEWWLKNLEGGDFLQVAKEAFQRRLETEKALGCNALQETKREFCIEHDDFIEFIREAV